MLYKDKDNNPRPTLYHKPTDQQSYLHAKSEHPRKDVSYPKAIPACIHFRKEGYEFIQHAKFILIEQLTETENVGKATLKFKLKQMDDFWILKLDTSTSKDLNQERNNVYSPMAAFAVQICYFTATRKKPTIE